VVSERRLELIRPGERDGGELDQRISACLIGGASLFGAKGGAFGAAAGALIVGTLNNGDGMNDSVRRAGTPTPARRQKLDGAPGRLIIRIA
jgi:ABC-type xylose transport system permease subunit